MTEEEKNLDAAPKKENPPASTVEFKESTPGENEAESNEHKEDETTPGNDNETPEGNDSGNTPGNDNETPEGNEDQKAEEKGNENTEEYGDTPKEDSTETPNPDSQISGKTIEEDKEAIAADKEFNGIEIKDKFPLLEKLLSLFKAEGDLNPLLSGYVVKVLTALIDKNKQKLWRYLDTYSDHMNTLFTRCADQSVVNLIVRLLESVYGESVSKIYLNLKRKLIKRLIEDEEESNLEGRYSVMNAIIHTNLEIPYFMSDEIVNLLFKYTERNPSLGLALLKCLNEMHNTEREKITSNQNASAYMNDVCKLIHN